jgi:hypothetical protein
MSGARGRAVVAPIDRDGADVMRVPEVERQKRAALLSPIVDELQI